MDKGKMHKTTGLVSGIFMLALAISSMGISTYAWFQAEAAVRINTTSSDATITVSAPEGSKFFYFKGNGEPGESTYLGYSSSDAVAGNKTNIINKSDGSFSTDGGDNYVSTAGVPVAAAVSGEYEGKFENDAWAEIDGSDITADSCFDLSKMRPGCYYSFCASYKTSSSFVLKMSQFTDSISGSSNDINPHRYIYDGSSISDSLSLAQVINSYSYISTASTLASDSPNYIKKSIGGTVNDMTLSGDNGNPYNSDTNAIGIGYDGLTDASKNIDFTLASSSSSTDTTYFVFFTIYMESDKNNALLYHSTSSGNYRYTKSNTGTYHPYEGLAVEMSSISITNS